MDDPLAIGVERLKIPASAIGTGASFASALLSKGIADRILATPEPQVLCRHADDAIEEISTM
jgi:hypothetical protein